ncbi:MAG: HNH endonuclease [Deltaproteobacteria bacterium]|nr:HNH endonuclease [Deltaproteobacteria bacterium]
MEINIWSGEGLPAAKNIGGRGLKVKTTEEKGNPCLEMVKSRNISSGEREIKALLNSGFIIKNDENFLLNTYGFIDKDVRSNFNDLFIKNNFVEVQGASFSSMTPYGRNITVKNLIMSSEKFNKINSEKYEGNYAKYDEKFNEEYKLSKFTLKNYFDLKQTVPGIDAKNTAPGVINIETVEASDGGIKQVKYSISEIPSSYKFKFDKKHSDIFSDTDKRPELGILKEYKDTTDGFKNIKITVNDKKILEIESIHNWQKIMNYVKTRDIQFLRSSRRNEGDEISDRVEVHHIKQLQDDGKENVRNLIALGEDTHRLADSYKILIDKNTGYYRERYFNSEAVNMVKSENIAKEKNYAVLLENISNLVLNDKIMLNDIKLDVETNSAMRLTMLTDTGENLRLLFIDGKTGEELRLLAAKTDYETEKNIAKTALINIVKELATGI